MKKLLLLTTILFIGTISISNAQKIKLKKGNLLVDGKEIMTYDREDMGTQKIHLFDKNKTEQILMIRNQNETRSYYDDDFVQIKFLQIGEMVEMKLDKTWKGIIGWLIEREIITLDGMLNEKNIPLFVKNYDENITNRTIRH